MNDALDAASFVATLPPGLSSSEKAQCVDCFNTGNLPPYNEPSCRGTVSSFDVGTALKNTAISSAVGSVPFVGNFLNAIVGGVLGHHGQAVKQEQATLCQAVPIATAFLQGIDQLVQSGQLDPATAGAALDQGFQNWRPLVQNIIKDTGGKCNAACAYERYFQCAIAGRKAQYAAAQGFVSVGSPALTPAQAVAGVSPVLASAGFTQSSQSTLATFVLVGGGVLVGVVVLSILRGR